MDLPTRERLRSPRSSPGPTVVALVATVALVAGTLVVDATGDTGAVWRTGIVLAVFTALFAVRVGGQLLVLSVGPDWLPPMGQWNLVPYPILLPIQLALLGTMIAVTVDLALGANMLPPGGRAVGVSLVVFACVYGAAMAVRYTVRMARRPEQRWFGGAIPIVFHLVLAAWLLVLGLFHASG
jgi:uncharacterized protein